MKKTYKTTTPIYRPASADKPAQLLAEIEVDAFLDDDGDEVLTPESIALIENTTARYLGLMTGRDIKMMRKRLSLTQDELSELLGCGKKSLSRWENGKGYPSGIINKMLRLIDEGFLSPASLNAVEGPRPEASWPTQLAKEYAQPKNREILRYNFSFDRRHSVPPVTTEELTHASA